MLRLLAATVCISSLCLVSPRQSAAEPIVWDFTTSVVAVQQVVFPLLGFDDPIELVATGPLHWQLELDDEGNSVPDGMSSFDLELSGFLPPEFGSPLAGLPFQMTEFDDAEITITGGGATTVVNATLGINLLSPDGTELFAELYTRRRIELSNMDSQIPYPVGTVFEDPDRPDDEMRIRLGENVVGAPPGVVVGTSFDRRIIVVPELATGWLWLVLLASTVWCRRR